MVDRGRARRSLGEDSGSNPEEETGSEKHAEGSVDPHSHTSRPRYRLVTGNHRSCPTGVSSTTPSQTTQ